MTLGYLRTSYDAVFLALGQDVGRRLGAEGAQARGVIGAMEFLRETGLGRPVTVGAQRPGDRRGQHRLRRRPLRDQARRRRRQPGQRHDRLPGGRGRTAHPARGPGPGPGRGRALPAADRPGQRADRRATATSAAPCWPARAWPGTRTAPSGRRSPRAPSSRCRATRSWSRSGRCRCSTGSPRTTPSTGWSRPTNSAACRTPSAAVFAGGDVMRGPSMVVDALGDGKRAARDIDRVLSAEPLRPEDPVEVMPYEKLNTAYFRHAPRTEAPLAPAAERRASQVTEVTLAYSREQALAEADRCMSCGVCNGCDNCYIVCPDVSVMRDAGRTGTTRSAPTTARAAWSACRSAPPAAWSGCRSSTSTSRATWSGWRPRSRRTRARTPSRPRSPASSSRTRSPSTTGHDQYQ